MKIYLFLIFLINVFHIFCQENEEEQRTEQQRLADMMKHDGVKRVVAVTEKNIEKILKKNDIVVVMFWVDNEKATEKLSEKDMNFLEVVAQLFAGRKIGVATCEILTNQKFAKDVGVKYTGMIKIFNKGRISTYYGQRSTDVLFPYLAKTMTDAITIIQTKAEKKQFDANDLPKVVAYVAEKSKELKELRNAALNFQPMIPFYVIHDAKLAKAFHLKKVNTLQLAKPYEKAVTFSSKKGISEEAVVRFVNENKRQRVTKMRLENLHSVWAIDSKGFVVPVFAITKTEEGNRFFSLIRSLSKQFEKSGNLSFIWIDPEPFPAMVDYWSQSFQIDPTKPTFGIVDVHTQTSAWFPVPADEKYVLNDMKKWVNDVLKERIPLAPMTPYQPRAPPENSADDQAETENTSDSGKGNGHGDEL